MRAEVLIIGGGPAGLAAAIALRQRGGARVVVIEREAEAGGIPRHADHIGFGMRDLHRLLSGPAYARRYADLAHTAGVDVRVSTTATRWLGPTHVSLTSPRGIDEVEGDAVLLATGCRERPRPARLVAGDRPAGVFTTGALQQLVHLHRCRVGERAVVIGAEHVSFSAVLTLAEAGARVAAMVTEHARHQTHPPFKWLSADRLRVPILTEHRVHRIVGRGRVEAVELLDLRSSRLSRIECDTVVFTGDWIPDHELARRGGLVMDAVTRAPRVDGALRTSVPGVFGAGNLLHAAETADVAALGGRHAAQGIARYLETRVWPERDAVPIECEAPVSWISPSAVRPDAPPPRRRFVWRVSQIVARAEAVVRQGDRILWRHAYDRLIPALSLYAPADWIGAVDAEGPPVSFQLERGQ